MEIINGTENIIVPDSAVEFRYSRSSGKGGQNVNKVSSKVELILDLRLIESSDAMKAHLLQRLHPHTDSLKKIHIVSQESRSQLQNKRTSVKKMVEMLLHASKVEKERIPTSKSKTAKKKQIENKKKKGAQKKMRRRISADEE